MDTDFSNKKILIVEAFKVFRDIIKQASLSLGSQCVDVCTNSKDALVNCKSTEYDIIFLGYDLGEGKKNGQQVLEEIRVHNYVKRSSVILLITAESSQEMVLCALEHKPDFYLTKPFTTKELLKRLLLVMHKKHELRKVYQAMDENKKELAITFCNQHIAEEGRYTVDCLGIKAKLLFELGKLDDAEKIYRLKCEDKSLQWPVIGLGKVHYQRKEYDQAAKLFKQIIDEYPCYMSAYELLTNTYQAQGEYDLAQLTIEKAIETSPRSINLVQQYAALCELNNQFEKSTFAFKRTLELSKNSIHYSPEKALDFARSVNEHAKELDKGQVTDLVNKALKELAEVNKEFSSKSVKIRTGLATASLYFQKNDKYTAAQTLLEAEKLYQRHADELPSSIVLDLAQSYAFMQNEGRSNVLLEQLVAENSHNHELMAQVDRAVDEPLSEQGKKSTQKILKTGIDFYNAENYLAAIIEFTTALNHYPKHVGIKLNLIQALVMSYSKNNSKISHLKRAKTMLEQLSDLPKNHQHFSRLITLREKLKEIETAVT